MKYLLVVVAVVLVAGLSGRRWRLRRDAARGIDRDADPLVRQRNRAFAAAYLDALVIFTLTWMVVVFEVVDPRWVVLLGLLAVLAAGYLRTAAARRPPADRARAGAPLRGA